MDTLFDPAEKAHARRTDPLASHLAAERASVALSDLQERILHALRIGGPATDEELVARHRRYWPERRVSDQSIRSRRAELVKKGLVETTGDRRPTEYQQLATVWRAT